MLTWLNIEDWESGSVAGEFLSPVSDSSAENSIISSVLVELDVINNPSIQISFRSSNVEFSQLSDNVLWSGFTLPGQVPSNVALNIQELGIYSIGRYFQIKILVIPSVEVSSLNSITVDVSLKTNLINLSSPSYVLGTVSGQIVDYVGDKEIHKVTLNLGVTATDVVNYIIGSGDNISFQSINFQESRHEWVFQPHFHWVGNWATSGMTVKNSLQTERYIDEIDAIENAPYLGYKIYFPNTGTYDLWGYGYVDGGGAYWSFNNDSTNLRVLTLGSQDSGYQGVPKWTKFGTVFVEEAGVYNFKIYLRDTDVVILDQWFFTKNTNLDYDFGIMGENALFAPLPVSKCPFVTAVRLRTLISGSVDDLDDPYFGATSITMWLPSSYMRASGNFNYEVKNNMGSSGVVFSDGLSIEFWQIGGSKDFFSSWNYISTNSSVGLVFSSTDYGQTYV